MNPQGRIPRTRGGICGVLLILLGLWGGLAPLAGPYFHFGYTPDQVWHLSAGRLYFSAVPGAAAVVGGLLAAGTRSRVIGSVGGLLAALGGAWFVAGTSVVTHVLHRSIPVGSPILGASNPAMRSYLEQMALFTGVGLLLVFVGALTMGRFSPVSARDRAAEEESYYADMAAAPAIQSATGQFPARFPAGPFSGGSGELTQPTAPTPPPGAFADTGTQESTTAQYPPDPMP